MEGLQVLMPVFEKEDLLNNFLLGEISEGERAALEDRVLSDDEFFEQLLVVEDELIDAYMGNDLSAQERRLFEARFHAAPRDLERLEFAKTLRRSLVGKNRGSSGSVGFRSGWRALVQYLPVNGPFAWATAMVLVAIAFGGIWIFINRSRADERNQQALNQPSPPRSSPVVQQKDNESAREVTTPTPLPVPSPSLPKKSTESTRPVVATFILTPGLSRDAGPARDLTLPQGATHLHFRLPLEQDRSAEFKRYHLLLSLADGPKVWSGIVKPSGDSTLGLNLPARLLQRGDYVLEVKGVTADGNFESIAEYSFRILQK